MTKYIYEYENWPHFTWDTQSVQLILGETRHLQGKLMGQMSALGFSLKEETQLATLTLDVLKSSEIEGETLNYQQVRSSIARRLGLEYAGMVAAAKDIEGIVEMMLDATQNYTATVDDERLFGWHAALFPLGRSGMYKIEAGQYRTSEMQVVSGSLGKEKIHYQAPPAHRVKNEMQRFLQWLNTQDNQDPVLKSAIAHFWFVIIHPFDDGNGRIARAISDLLLSRGDKSCQRFYSLSNQILQEKKLYYETLQKVILKVDFWEYHKNTPINERQRLMLNKLLEGFEGKLKTSKWAKIAKCSTDTALRDVQDLVKKNILQKETEGGRSANYSLVSPHSMLAREQA